MCFGPLRQLGDFQRTARHAPVRAEVIISTLRCILTGEREVAFGIQRRVIQNQREVAVVLAAPVSARITERITPVLTGPASTAPSATETAPSSAAEASAAKATTPAAETSAARTTTAGAWTRTCLRARSARPIHTKTIGARSTGSIETAGSQATRAAGTETHPVILLRRIHAIADAAVNDESFRGALVEVPRIRAGRRRLRFRLKGCSVLSVHIQTLESAAGERLLDGRPGPVATPATVPATSRKIRPIRR